MVGQLNWPLAGQSAAGISGDNRRNKVRITIEIEGWKEENQKEIINSIKGLVKSLAKRFRLRAVFRVNTAERMME